MRWEKSCCKSVKTGEAETACGIDVDIAPIASEVNVAMCMLQAGAKVKISCYRGSVSAWSPWKVLQFDAGFWSVWCRCAWDQLAAQLRRGQRQLHLDQPRHGVRQNLVWRILEAHCGEIDLWWGHAAFCRGQEGNLRCYRVLARSTLQCTYSDESELRDKVERFLTNVEASNH